MPNLRSLTSKYILLSLAILVCFTGLVWLSFVLTAHMQGEARKINLAGRQRMQVLRITLAMHALTGVQPLPPGQQYKMDATVRSRMKSYEAVFKGLRNGDASLGLEPVHWHDRESLARLKSLMDLWEQKQKPLLEDILAAPAVEQRESCNRCHEFFRNGLADVEGLVTALDHHFEVELRKFGRLRLAILAVFTLVACGMVFYLYQEKTDRPGQTPGKSNLDDPTRKFRHQCAVEK